MSYFTYDNINEVMTLSVFKLSMTNFPLLFLESHPKRLIEIMYLLKEDLKSSKYRPTLEDLSVSRTNKFLCFNSISLQFAEFSYVLVSPSKFYFWSQGLGSK